MSESPPRAYPLPRPDADPRFTFGLAVDVADVLERHGYPPVRAGLDVVELQTMGPFLRVGYRVRLVNRSPGSNELYYAALFNGGLYNDKDYTAQLIDKAHGEVLNVAITGQGRPLRDWEESERVGAVKYGWALFPQPSRKTDRLSFYIPAFGVLDDLPVK